MDLVGTLPSTCADHQQLSINYDEINMFRYTRHTLFWLINIFKMQKFLEMFNLTHIFSLKSLEILHQERRVQLNSTVMEPFNSILFHKSEPVNKQYTNQLIITE